MDKNKVIRNLHGFIKNKEELENVLKTINHIIAETFTSCLQQCFTDTIFNDNQIFEIESVIDYLQDELNTGHWSEIPLHIRRAFSTSNYVKAIFLLKVESYCTKKVLKDCIKCLDMGLLLGAPLEINSDLLTQSATYISQEISVATEKNISQDYEEVSDVKKKKRKTSNSENLNRFNLLKGITVDSLSCPSVESFSKYFASQKPVKLQDCMTHWPAVSKWLDIKYLLQVAGDRTVPVEIGSHYTDDSWHQKLITLKHFIKQYFLEDSNEIGYLAQHNLFNQIPELRNDICIPDYCCLGESEDEPDINAWFGPAGTVSPLHQDPKNNILAQIFGTKQIILFHPNDEEFLYPFENQMLSNTAQVDPINPDLGQFENFAKATSYRILLEPGDMLFIPKKWWHHVTAFDKSFSVSFWWN